MDTLSCNGAGTLAPVFVDGEVKRRLGDEPGVAASGVDADGVAGFDDRDRRRWRRCEERYLALEILTAGRAERGGIDAAVHDREDHAGLHAFPLHEAFEHHAAASAEKAIALPPFMS